MNKWVCITNELTYRNFTYGKIYEGNVYNNLLDLRNDLDVKKLVQYYSDIPIARNTTQPICRGSKNFKESKRFFGIPTRKTYFFIELEEWRNQQIDKII
jgi:hypothetical protein